MSAVVGRGDVVIDETLPTDLPFAYIIYYTLQARCHRTGTSPMMPPTAQPMRTPASPVRMMPRTIPATMPRRCAASGVIAASRAGGGQDRARLEFFIADIMPEVRISGHEDGHATHIPATDDTDPTWSFPPTIWDATDQQEPLAPELQRPDAYVRSLMVERDALALSELRLLLQAAPMPAAQREAVQTALNAL